MSTLGEWWPLQFYGPAAAAVVCEDSSAAVAGDVQGWATPDAEVAGTSSVPTAHVTGLKNGPATITAAGEVTYAYPRGRARPTATVSIGAQPSATDIAEAVVAQRVHGLGPGAITVAEAIGLLTRLARNAVVTDPAAGTYTVYDDDDVTPLYVADLWENAAGTVPYGGSGAERRDRFA